MISVRFTHNRLTLLGHAGYAEKGQDTGLTHEHIPIRPLALPQTEGQAPRIEAPWKIAEAR